ncbi:hypothetical protein ACGFY6_29590 [Streptomyces sp. NPDC048387]|uniref:hypothetical protein n=1 Tax=Streptomyces sp. NPDC048387 TaxID=3365542 RepID=UPI003718ECBB
MDSTLPRRTPGARGRIAAEPPEPIPWDAFAVGADVTAAYGQPSPALIERARRGWKKLGSVHTRAGVEG